MRRLRGKLTYSNVISTLCLCLLIGGGTAYAASQLDKESVGARQLKKEAVTPAKLSKASKATLTGPRGATGERGPQGAAGRDGDRGIQGPPGKEGTPGKDGAAGPGAVTIEDTATAGFRQVGTFGGVKVLDSCESGGVSIVLEASGSGNTLAYFGSESKNMTISGPSGTGIAAHSASATSTLAIDFLARDTSVGLAWQRFDLYIAKTTCALSGTVTSSTLK